MAAAEQRPLTVCCCLWGDWPAKGWGAEYVSRLKRGVERNLSIPHTFVCFADDVSRVPEGIDAKRLDVPVWDGCLPKLGVYAPGAILGRRALLLDLDNVITGPLDDIASYDGDYCVRAGLPDWDRGQRVLDGDMIAFDPDKARGLWDAFMANPQKAAKDTRGRERFFIRENIEADVWQEVCPGQVVSYKSHVRGKGLPGNARIVSCHGNPRPHEIDEGWVREHWV